MRNLRLSQKGLIFVCSLLVLEVVFLGTLFALLRNAEYETKRYEHSNAVLAKASGFLNILVEAGEALVGYAVIQSPALGKRFDRAAARVPVELAELKDLVKGEESVAVEKVERMDRLLTSGFNKLTSYRRQIESNGDASAKDLARAVTNDFKSLMKELKEFHQDIKNHTSKLDPETAHRMREQVQMVIAFGIIANIVVALLTMRFFVTGVTRKLDVLTENTVRLASGVPLANRLNGDDELAHLDGVFHHMAQELAESSKKEKQATETAQANEERVSAIIENMPVGLIAIEESGCIQSINPRTEQIFGYKQEELLGKHISELFSSNQSESTASFVERLKKSSSKNASEMEAQRKNGETFPAELALNEFQSNDVSLLLVNVQDVTERHEVERLKREFVAMVSHDLRTPLTSVHGSLTLLSAGALGELSADAHEVVATAESEIERLTNLVNDLLDVARIEAGKLEVHLEETDLMPIIRRSIASISNLASKSGIEIQKQETKAKVLADSDRMVQVLVNLLSNAVKFSPQDSAVLIAMRDVDDWVEVRVTDQGRGIPEDHLESIFQRFHQVESGDATKKGGTGLGLPICKTIVENHGGTIGVESEVGKGSTFWFRLRKVAARQEASV